MSEGFLDAGVPRASKRALGHFIGDVDDRNPSAERERSHATVQRHEGLFTRTVSVKMSLPTYL